MVVLYPRTHSPKQLQQDDQGKQASFVFTIVWCGVLWIRLLKLMTFRDRGVEVFLVARELD